MDLKVNYERDEMRKHKKENQLKAYGKPEIKKLGAIQKITLGGSIGIGDSGATDYVYEPPQG